MTGRNAGSMPVNWAANPGRGCSHVIPSETGIHVFNTCRTLALARATPLIDGAFQDSAALNRNPPE
jgi:hypothetical protein